MKTKTRHGALTRGALVIAGVGLLSIPAVALAARMETKYADQHFSQYETVPGIRHTKVYSNYLAFSSGGSNQACAGQRDFDSDAFFGNYTCWTSTNIKAYAGGAGSKLRPVAHDSSGPGGLDIEAREQWES